MKRVFKLGILVLLVAVVGIFTFTACNADETQIGVELVTNGSFENGTSTDSGITLDGWTLYSSSSSDTSISRSTYTSSDSTKAKDSGSYYIKINNTSATVNYISQSIKVDRNVPYKITYNVRIPNNITTGSDDYATGVHVTFLENTDYILGEKKQATNGWVSVELYVVSKNTDYLTLCVKLGDDNARAKGIVWIDNISMKRVEGVPVGAQVHEINRNKIVRYNETTSGIIFVTLLTILTAAIAITAYIFLRRNYSRRDALKDFAPSGESKAKKFISHPATIAGIISIAAIAIRFALLFTLFGNGAETARLIMLARKVAELHPTGIMSYLAKYSSSQVIYTPGILYILYAIGGIGYYVPDAGLSQLLRLPALLCDIGTVLIIYFYGRKYVGNKISTIFASLYAILPVAFVMSGLRGSFESILAFLLVFGFILLIEKKYIPMYAVMVLAVLLDIRALAVVPLAVCYLVYMYYKADKTLKTFGKIRATIIFGFVASLVCFYLLSLPFMINDVRAGSFFKILVYYKDIMATNNIFVSNAFNLYGMVAMNNKIVTKTVSILNLIFLLILMIYVISLYVKNRNRLELILLASFTLAVIAVFTLKISETYLFLSLALMLIYTMISGEKRMYIVFSGYSILSFLNIGQLLSQSGLIIANSKHAIVSFETTGVFYILFSVVAVLLTLYYGYVTYSICNNDKLIDIKPMPENLIQTIKNSFNKLKKRIKKVG